MVNVGKYTGPMDPMGMVQKSSLDVLVNPENERIRPLKSDHFYVGNTSSNHRFSGDMLVFRGVHPGR